MQEVWTALAMATGQHWQHQKDQQRRQRLLCVLFLLRLLPWPFGSDPMYKPSSDLARVVSQSICSFDPILHRMPKRRHFCG
jgi:hypothetical protein